MPAIFDVSPFDGGWCVKVRETGEVLFFTARRAAASQAHRLAGAWPDGAQVRVHPGRGAATEAWPQPSASCLELAVPPGPAS